MANINKIFRNKLKSRLTKLADDKTKLWWENYVKHNTLFRGVGIPKIRKELQAWYSQEQVEKLTLNEQLDLAISFFSEKYAEDKLAGILFLQIYLYEKFNFEILLPKFEVVFYHKYIYDWNICD